MRISSKAPVGEKPLVLADGVNSPLAKKRLVGVTVIVKPVDTAMRVAGKHAAWRALALLAADSPDRDAVAEVAYTKALTRLGIIAWGGVFAEKDDAAENGAVDGEADEVEKEIALAPGAIESALSDQDFYEAMDVLYVSPDLARQVALDTEKNG